MTEEKKTGSVSGKIILSVAVVAAIFFIAGFYTSGSITGAAVANPEDVAQKAVDFINTYMLPGSAEASLVNATPQNGMVLANIQISDGTDVADYQLYVSSDGKYMFTYNPIDLEQTPQILQPQQESGDIPKSDRPAVDVFVMSYCPYGLQMEKALLPAWKLLKDKADIHIRFVNYIMHGKQELDENTRQYCIQKEQSGKYISYLECFTATGEAETCLSSSGVDITQLEACIAATDEEFNITAQYNDQSTWINGRFPPYDVDTALCGQYGVRGSPTVVINGKVVSVNRSPEAVKQAICSAFNTPPEECSQTLNTQTASPGIGGGSGSGSAGSCG